MPIYEYCCKDCDSTFERLVFQTDRDPVHCPQCRGTNVTRLMSASSVFSNASLGRCAAPAGGGFS